MIKFATLNQVCSMNLCERRFWSCWGEWWGFFPSNSVSQQQDRINVWFIMDSVYSSKKTLELSHILLNFKSERESDTMNWFTSSELITLRASLFITFTKNRKWIIKQWQVRHRGGVHHIFGELSNSKETKLLWFYVCFCRYFFFFYLRPFELLCCVHEK